MNYIEQLEYVIHKLYKVRSTHRWSAPVRLELGDEWIWTGVVEVFHLHNHPEALIAYAWSHCTDDLEVPLRSTTVLHGGPVVSPEAAVRWAVLNDLSHAGPNQVFTLYREGIAHN